MIISQTQEEEDLVLSWRRWQAGDPLGPPPFTPKQVLTLLVQLNEWHHGLFLEAMNAVQWAMEELRYEE